MNVTLYGAIDRHYAGTNRRLTLGEWQIRTGAQPILGGRN